MPITYVLFSNTIKKFYTGSSRENEVDDRLNRHNGGYVKSTKCGKPWIVVLVESFPTYQEARKHELFLKSGVGRQRIRKLFQDKFMERYPRG